MSGSVWLKLRKRWRERPKVRTKRRWSQNEKSCSVSYGTGLYPENKEAETWSDAQAQPRRIILATFWGWIVRASVEEARPA